MLDGLTLEALVVESASSVRPPKRLTVAEAAEEYRRLNNPGAYVGPLKNEMTPYLIEPMNTLQSRDFTGWAFVGPAQCAKTEVFLNWLTYSITCDPADMMLVQTSMATARDFSMRRVDRMHRHSPRVGEFLAAGSSADNTFDKHYKSGMMLSLAWPTINELSGKPIPRLFLTDYDRMPSDVDGEGEAFDLARKRATTFRQHGMCAAESSPGFVVSNPKWTRKTKHEAPPTKGILSLYNRGDRRRWYWTCVKCEERFEPSFNLLDYPDSKDFLEAAELASLVCPYCQQRYFHDPSGYMPGKHELNQTGRWIKDGQVWLKDGRIEGTALRSTIASFWLKGVAAAFADWKTLVFNFLSAQAEYENSGSEDALKTTTNTDQGEAYIPKSVANDRVPEAIKAKARDYGERVVPPEVRFLIATVDVQKNRFVVQVHGIALNKDIYVIDRFEIKKSKRLDADGEHLWVNPGSYSEDWKLVAEQVLAQTYPLGDHSGRRMAVKLTMCDSGGKAGVTANAYDFVRWLRTGDEEEDEEDQGAYSWDAGMAGRFLLLKGNPNRFSPRVAITHPDSQRKDRNAGARGEIPVALLNVNQLKDMVDNRLDRDTPGGRFCFPDWLDNNFYTELTVEVKDPVKGWINPRSFRNESWDLLAYCIGATLTPMIQLDYMNAEAPPSWAAVWDENDLVFDPVVEEKPFDVEPKEDDSDLAALAGALA